MQLLELGESDVLPAGAGDAFLAALADYIPPERLEEARHRVARAMQSRSHHQQLFGPARALYDAIFAPASYTAIDLEKGPRRYCLDLNGPVDLGMRFDCVINNGTSEHVFDQANVYRIIHAHTKIGGVMIHFTPGLGWQDHGLFHAQPGFFFDLAAANNYEPKLIGLANEEVCHFLPSPASEELFGALRDHPSLFHAELCALLRKTTDAPFVNPLQGRYGAHALNLGLAQISRRRSTLTRRNLALNRPALQSSTAAWSWHDDPALDAAGGNNGRVTGYYSFSTDLEVEPWWMVDLGAAVSIDEVIIHNRLDDAGLASYCNHLTIQLSDDGEDWRQAYIRADDTTFGGADGNPLRVELRGQSARYLRIELPYYSVLSLDEIEVY
jgi:hypothetical protein